MRSWPLLLVSLVLAGVMAAMAVENGPSGDQVSKLREGNRLYREGRLEEAREVYLAGFDPESPHPVLAYNLATTFHHLGELPEAILWYRRAEAANPGDPWMRDNLFSARASLGLQPYASPGMSGLVSRHATSLSYAGALLAWIGLILWIVGPRKSAVLALSLVGVGTLLFAATIGISRGAPRAAVILVECTGAEGDLPAGSEIWITEATDENVLVVAGPVTLECPRGAVAPVADAS